MAVLNASYHHISLSVQKGFVLPNGWRLKKQIRGMQLFLDNLHAATITRKTHSGRAEVSFRAGDPDFQRFIKDLLRKMDAHVNLSPQTNDETEFEKALLAAFRQRHGAPS
jgi:hypothetical protein